MGEVWFQGFIMVVKYLDYTYEVNDSFATSIPTGQSQPYTGELNIIRRYLGVYPEKNRRFLDIGGHIGTYCIPLSVLYSEVFSYEPNPDTFCLLNKNILMNNIKNVHIFNCAVGSHGENVNIMRHGNNSGCFTTYKDKVGSIKSIILDDIYKDDIDFIKIDVEGSELDVLIGAADILKTSSPLLSIEINGLCEKLHGSNKKDIFTFLHNMDYDLYCQSNDYFFIHSKYLSKLR